MSVIGERFFGGSETKSDQMIGIELFGEMKLVSYFFSSSVLCFGNIAFSSSRM